MFGHAGRLRVPEHDQVPPRAGERDVDAFRRHEHAPTVDAAERQHDDVLLLPLKRIHGTHLDHAVVLPGPVVVLDHLSDGLARHDPGEVVDDGALLRFVKGDHTNLAGGHAELDNPRGDQSGEARLSRRILASTLLRHVPRPRIYPHQRRQRRAIVSHSHERAPVCRSAPVHQLTVVEAIVRCLTQRRVQSVLRAE